MVMDALRSLDFFVVADLFMTDTAKIADIVLPAGSWMERSGVSNNDQTSINNFHLQQKVVQHGECWTDYKIFNEMAKRLGFADRMFPDDEAYFDFVLEPSGMTFEEFRKVGVISVPYTFKKYEANGFKTPSGKIQLYDERLKDLGFDPLPGYHEPTESPVKTPELAKEYPLIITTGGRVPVFRHSELRNIPILREIVSELLVSINPKTAGELGINDGDLVTIESPRGNMEAKAYLTEGIDPRVVQVPSHWAGKNNVNRIMDNANCAPMIGSIQYRCQLCRVEKKG
jgi:anaerobic selenocysteine-containing dehydrogenase